MHRIEAPLTSMTCGVRWYMWQVNVAMWQMSARMGAVMRVEIMWCEARVAASTWSANSGVAIADREIMNGSACSSVNENMSETCKIGM